MDDSTRSRRRVTAEDRKLRKQIAELKAAVERLSTPSLGNSSVHGGRLVFYDNNDNPTTVVGNQGDGSAGVRELRSPELPRPSTPVVGEVSKVGSVPVHWDGNVADGETLGLPEIWGRTDVLALQADGDNPPDMYNAPVVSTIRDREGGGTTVALDIEGSGGTFYLALRFTGADRETRSELSDPARVVVEPLVDTSAWEAELEEAKTLIEAARQDLEEGEAERAQKIAELEERATTLQENLTRGLDDVYAAAEARAQELADNAVVQAASAAQSEYDRLQTAAQEAQARADAVAAEMGATSEAAQQARAEAEAAAAAAGEAQSLAAAAHEAAGSASELAQTAYSRAGSMGSILGGTTGPAGVAPEGSYWIQWSSAGADGEPQQLWKYEDGNWEAQNIDPAFFPVIDIGFGTVGVLHFQRLIGIAIQAQHLFIGDQTELLPEEMLWNFREEGLNDFWQATTGQTRGWGTITNQMGMPILLRYTAPDPDQANTSRLAFTAGGKGLPVKPGEKFRLSARGWTSAASRGQLHIEARYTGDDLGYVSRSRVYTIDGNDLEAEWEVPANADIRRMQLEFTSATAATGNAHWGDFKFQRMTPGVLLEDGAVSAVKVDTEEFFSNEAVIEKIWAEIVRARLVQSQGIITEDMIATGAITTPKLTVTDDLVAEIAKILHLSADQVEMNQFVARSGMVGVLEAIGITLSDEAAGRKVEVSGQGVQIIDTEAGEAIFQIGLYGEDFISMNDEDGNPAVTINRNGLVAGRQVSADEDIRVGGRSLLGGMTDSPGWADHDAILDPIPRGIVAQLRRPFSETSTTGSEVSIGYLQAYLLGGRTYQIRVPTFSMGTQATDASFKVYQTTSTSGWPNVPNSTGTDLGETPMIKAPNLWPRLYYEKVIRPREDGYYRWNFVVARKSGSSMTFNTSDTGTAYLLVEDIGANINNTGRPLFQLSGNSGNMPTSSTIALRANPTQGRTYISGSHTSTSWSAGTPEANRWRFGFWQTPGGAIDSHYISAIRFGPQTSLVSGREVISATWRVFVDAWARKTIGDSVQPGIRTVSSDGSLPGTINPNTVEWLEDVQGLLPQRWASIPVPEDVLEDVIAGRAQLVLGRPSLTRRGGAATPINGGVELVLHVEQD